MIDTHTHSLHSHDGHENIFDMVEQAKKIGCSYLAITDHLDLDYLFCSTATERQLDMDSYFKDFKAVVKNAGLELAFGVEVGYSNKSENLYENKISSFPIDVVINSVHTLNDIDLYHFLPNQQPAEKKHLFIDYLNAILCSIKAQYKYDVVGHIGYISRYVTYKEKYLLFDDTRDLIDQILKTIIQLNKTIELNTNVKTLPFNTLPEPQIIERYRELGGENITFGSDAHTLNRIGDGYYKACAIARACGFKYWTVYLNRTPKKILIE
ncbi:MAG: histidinol-phosphatase HisJ family protein [Christensenellaceae bacterium]|jgi:histidinol-phosphatase (PHP family)|nr:histidinol-phosphatase HisJ family protein [Christensenellaceae bacterium]